MYSKYMTINGFPMVISKLVWFEKNQPHLCVSHFCLEYKFLCFQMHLTYCFAYWCPCKNYMYLCTVYLWTTSNYYLNNCISNVPWKSFFKKAFYMNNNNFLDEFLKIHVHNCVQCHWNNINACSFFYEYFQKNFRDELVFLNFSKRIKCQCWNKKH